MKKVAVVILNWNGRKMLETYLSNVVACSQEQATVIVADNASTDDSVEWLRQNHPEVPLILLDKNWGFAEGYNKALSQVDAEYYVLLNSDVEVSSQWLTPLLKFMDNHPEAAACQPKLLAMHDREAFEYAGACGGYLDRYGYPFCRGRIMETVEKDTGQYDTTAEVLWATGACLFIRSSDYNAVGGLDGRFFAHNEEIDLCWRLWQKGRKVYCIPASKVYHVGGGTLPKSNPRKTYLNFRNNLTMLYKNLPDEEWYKVSRMRLVLDYVAALKMLILEGNYGEFKAVLRARRDFSQWRHDFDDDRNAILASRVEGSSLACRKPYSILWRYYVKGQKHYSDLCIAKTRK